MEIKSIKFKGKATEIKYVRESDKSETVSTIKCEEERDPAFTKKAEELIPIFLKDSELPLYWAAYIEIKKINFGMQGLSGDLEIKINNPDTRLLMGIKTGGIVNKEIWTSLLNHCWDFINGKRAQLDMFKGNQEEQLC